MTSEAKNTTDFQQEREAMRQKAIARHKQELVPIMVELRHLGYNFETVDDLRQSGIRYQSAIPVLLHWLPRLQSAKESVVRALSVPWAKPAAGPILIREFKRNPAGESSDQVHSLRWAIGNALEVLVDKTLTDEMIELASNKQYGTARQMIVLGLGKIHDPRSIETLIALLKDKDVAGHAAKALGKLKAREALRALEGLVDHPQAWIRNEVKKAVARITKNHLSSLE